MTIVKVGNLQVVLRETGAPLLSKISFSIGRGKVLGLVGESGSGKSTLSLALLGHARPGAVITSGSVDIDGTDILSLRGAELKSARRHLVSYVAQDPATSLNPALRISTQLLETLRLPREIARDKIEEVLGSVGLPSEDSFIGRRPNELSGGQQQRIAIAMAVARRPRLIVFDEPATGLDVVTQRKLLDLVRHLSLEFQIASIYVTHDIAVVGDIADDTVVMKNGAIVEYGAVGDVLGRPKHPYSKQLISATPSMRARIDFAAPASDNEASGDHSVFVVKQLSASYSGKRVLNNISLNVRSGECISIVGESGSGKSTLSRCLSGLKSDWNGEVHLNGTKLAKPSSERSHAQRQAIQHIFQNPYGSLNPRHSVASILKAPLHLFHGLQGKHAHREVEQALERVELSRNTTEMYPPELSGGQRQRVAIARAILASPEVLICDEVTSALDVVVQASILRLLRNLLKDGLSMIFITHNLAVVRSISHRVAVLEQGEIIEFDRVDTVLGSPQKDYTKLLIANTLELPPSIEE